MRVPKPPTPPPVPLLSEQLKAAIERSGLSCYQIGKAAGIDRTLISRFLAGERSISLDTADAVARALRLKLMEVGRRRG